jgi:uncharacterized protein YjiS (DUF1127 family)
MIVSFIIDRIADAFRCRQSARELSGMSDRELWDLGLVRTDLDGFTGSTGV